MARVSSIALLLLSGLALSAALGPAKTCSTGVAEEDPTAVCVVTSAACVRFVLVKPSPFAS